MATPRANLVEHLLLHGPERLGDSELLALVIGGEARAAARAAAELLESVGGVAELGRADPCRFAAVKGLGEAAAAAVAAAVELGRRGQRAGRLRRGQLVRSSADAAEWARRTLLAHRHEEVWVLSLDAGCRLLSARRVARGGVHGCAVTPQDVLRPAVEAGASALLLVHNHPSGDPTPSLEDELMTRALVDVAGKLGLSLLDHLVVARDGCCSLLLQAA